MGTHEVENPDLIKKVELDSRGRVSLGSEFANKRVEITVDVLD